MKTVYVATNTADAHVVSGLLRQSGIEALVLDENLGPYGHSLGSVRVVVAPENETASRNLIDEWEAQPTEAQGRAPVEQESAPQSSSWGTAVVAAVVVALLAAAWYFGAQ